MIKTPAFWHYFSLTGFCWQRPIFPKNTFLSWNALNKLLKCWISESELSIICVNIEENCTCKDCITAALTLSTCKRKECLQDCWNQLTHTLFSLFLSCIVKQVEEKMERSENESGRGTAVERERWCCKVIRKGREAQSERAQIQPPVLLLFIQGPRMHQMTIIYPPHPNWSLIEIITTLF